MARFFKKFVQFRFEKWRVICNLFEFYSFFKKARYLKFIFNFILFLNGAFFKNSKK